MELGIGIGLGLDVSEVGREREKEKRSCGMERERERERESDHITSPPISGLALITSCSFLIGTLLSLALVMSSMVSTMF